jgi:hypothetical protein
MRPRYQCQIPLLDKTECIGFADLEEGEGSKSEIFGICDAGASIGFTNVPL